MCTFLAMIYAVVEYLDAQTLEAVTPSWIKNTRKVIVSLFTFHYISNKQYGHDNMHFYVAY